MHVRVCKCTLDMIGVGDNTVPPKSRKCALKPSASTWHLELRHSFIVFIKREVIVEISVVRKQIKDNLVEERWVLTTLTMS